MSRREPTHYFLPNEGRSITAKELSHANRDTQLEIMRKWFYSNYANPVENTPYESAEGGYIYIWGGPYDPLDVLSGEFAGLIPDKFIHQLAQELCDISWEWTRHAKDYDIDESIVQTPNYQTSFDESITNVEALLHLSVTDQQQKHLLKLLYANVITAVETYLSDFFTSAVVSDKVLMRQFVETIPVYKSEMIAVSDVFKVAENIEPKVRSYLMNVVWHRLNKVKLMFKDTLNVSFPDDTTSALFKAVSTRHDIVHRNGKKQDGGEHDISKDAVKNIIKQAKLFVDYLNKQCTDKLQQVAPADPLFAIPQKIKTNIVSENSVIHNHEHNDVL